MSDKPLILIVDDVPKNLQVLGSILKGESVDIAVATNGKQALKIVEGVLPDLILLDVMMPEMDGFATIKQLKAGERTASIPVIFLTARSEKEDMIAGLELGAVDYVTKPFNRVELLTRVKNHLELKRNRDALAAAVAAKDKLLSIISHDLRTPFAGVIGFAEYIIEHHKTMEDGQVEELASDILNVSQKAYRLFETLLSWSRSQTGKIEFSPENIPLYELVSDSIGPIEGNAKDKSIAIALDIPKTVTMHADPEMMMTVFRNLVGNAIKFTEEGGRITVSAEKNGEYITAAVADTGVGIPGNVQEKLFRIDEHVTTRGTAKEEGTGFGLLLVKEFVEKHNGSIQIESEPGKGSCFSMKFPVALSE